MTRYKKLERLNQLMTDWCNSVLTKFACVSEAGVLLPDYYLFKPTKQTLMEKYCTAQFLSNKHTNNVRVQFPPPAWWVPCPRVGLYALETRNSPRMLLRFLPAVPALLCDRSFLVPVPAQVSR